MTGWHLDWSKAATLAFCCLLIISLWFRFCAATYMPCSFTQEFLISYYYVSPYPVLDFLQFVSTLQTIYERVMQFCKELVLGIISSWPCSSSGMRRKERLIIVHSPAFGGRGMFVTGKVSTCLSVAIVVIHAQYRPRAKAVLSQFSTRTP